MARWRERGSEISEGVFPAQTWVLSGASWGDRAWLGSRLPLGSASGDCDGVLGDQGPQPGSRAGPAASPSQEPVPAFPGRAGGIWEHPGCGQTPREGFGNAQSQASLN